MKRLTKIEKQTNHDKAVEALREILTTGDTIYTVVTSRSGSGMYRHIKAVVATPGGTVRDISNLISDALGWKWHDEGAVGVSSCGMDIGFHLAYSLSRELLDDGYALRHRWL
jgi:hypothetical protein